jgi:outer membrane protein OmpA-like peptidoglycan-associated protein
LCSAYQLERLRTQLASLPLIGDQSVRIIGHADRVGSERYNDGLSLRRAIQVHRILSAGGMDVSKIGVMSKGERDNAVATADERPEPRNRRAEVEVKWSFTD